MGIQQMLRLLAVSIVACIALMHSGCSGNHDDDLVDGAYPRGIRNMGNTCFANAYWQVLVHNTHFKAYVESLPVGEDGSPHSAVVNATKDFVKAHEGGTKKPVVPRDFLQAYAQYSELFLPGIQQDSMEAFEASNNILSESSVLLGGPALSLFNFDLRKNFRCPNPLDDRFVLNPSNDIRLDLPLSDTPQRLADLLDSYFDTTFRPDHECDRPRRVHAGPGRSRSVDIPAHRGGWQNFQMETSPQLLVLQLKRFKSEYDRERGDIRLDLVRTKVDFTENLTLNQRVHGVDAEYRLTGVVRHMGQTLNGGHYVSDYWHPELESWVHADDSRTFLVTGPNLSSSTAYLLFYERTN